MNCYKCGIPRQERTVGDNYGEWIEEYCPSCGIYRKGPYITKNNNFDGVDYY